MKEDTLKLGNLITTEQQRDACHIALAPVTAGQVLLPGEHIGLREDGRAGDVKNPIGIVDPFLKQGVKEDEQFWMFLYPGSITSLRHDWTHPAFEKKSNGRTEEEAQALEFLEQFAVKAGRPLDDLMLTLQEAYNDGSAWCGGDRDQDLFNDYREELMAAYAIVTGREPLEPDAANEVYFSCAC